MKSDLSPTTSFSIAFGPWPKLGFRDLMLPMRSLHQEKLFRRTIFDQQISVTDLLCRGTRRVPFSDDDSRWRFDPELQLEEKTPIFNGDLPRNIVTVTVYPNSRLFEMVPESGFLLHFEPSTTSIADGFEYGLRPEMQW